MRRTLVVRDVTMSAVLASVSAVFSGARILMATTSARTLTQVHSSSDAVGRQ